MWHWVRAAACHARMETAAHRVRWLQTGMSMLGRLLAHPLPRIYEDGAGGALGPAVLVGNGMDAESFGKCGRDASTRLETEVIAPLSQWLALHDTLVAKNRELDAVRLEVDSRRRTVADLTVKEAAVRARAQRSRDDKHGMRVEETAKLLEHKTAKLNASHQEFVKFEEELHTRIVGLIRDAAYIKVHLSQSLANQGAALSAASKIVDATPIPEIAQADAAANTPLTAHGAPHAPVQGKPAPSPVTSMAGPSSHTTTPSADATNPFMGMPVPSSPPPHTAHHASASMPAM